MSRWLAVSVLFPMSFLPNSLPSTRGVGNMPDQLQLKGAQDRLYSQCLVLGKRTSTGVRPTIHKLSDQVT